MPIHPPLEEPRVLSGKRREFAAEVSDAELARRAQEGDQWATNALFRRYVVPVRRFALHLMANREDADDVVQEAFAHALQNLAKLRDPEAFRPWLYQIVFIRSRRAFRKRKVARAFALDRRVDDATLAQLASPGTSPEALAELRLIDDALRRLPLEERSAWVLRRVEGEKLEEVGKLLGCSLATAKRRIAAADTHVRAFARSAS
ncbi:MAG: RNA polymerase sigma factor [Myxococcota bacterium]